MARHLTWRLKRTLVMRNLCGSRICCTSVLNPSAAVDGKIFSKKSALRGESINVDEAQRGLGDSEVGDSCKRIVVTTLMRMLCVTEENARSALEEYPALAKQTEKMLNQNFHILRENGMYKSTIKENQFALTSKVGELKRKINLVEALDLNIDEAIALFSLDIKVLNKFVNMTKIDLRYLPSRNRVYYLAEKLNCDLKKICSTLASNRFMLFVLPPKLLTFTEFMLEMGIKPEHIISNMSCYQYSLHKLQTGIRRAKELGISPIRPWVIRASHRHWKIAEANFEARKALFDPTLPREEYLSRIFECDMELAKLVIKKTPALGTIAKGKLVANAKILRAEGFTIEQVARAPTIFVKSTETLKKRFAEWNAISNAKPDYIYMFTKSESKFREIISEERGAQNKKPPS